MLIISKCCKYLSFIVYGIQKGYMLIDKTSELLDICRATLRSDLSFLTLVGILKATPKVSYTYSGTDLETLFFFDTFRK